MTQEKFKDLVTGQLNRCENLLTSKGLEYAPEASKFANVDRLAHFKKAASIMNVTPKEAVLGMMSKHLVSISDMCSSLEDYSIERWDEKISDTINYLLILRAVVEEEIIEENRS